MSIWYNIEEAMNKSYPHNYRSYLFCLHYYCYFLRCCHFPQKRCFLFCYHLLFSFHLYPACLVAASSSSWLSDSETRPEQPVRLNPSPFPMLHVPGNQILRDHGDERYQYSAMKKKPWYFSNKEFL